MPVFRAGKDIFVINVTDGSPEDMAEKYGRDMQEILDHPEIYGKKEGTGDSGSGIIKEDISYEEFLSRLQKDLREKAGYGEDDIIFWPEGFTSESPIQQEEIADANRRYRDTESSTLLLDMLILKEKTGNGMNYFQRVDTRALYEACQKEGYDQAFSIITAHRDQVKTAADNAGRLDDRAKGSYVGIREQLILRPLNYHAHAGELQRHVYRRTGDVALVLYQLLGDKDGNLLTSKIHKKELERWGMADQEEKVLQDALENTARLFPPCVYDRKKGKEVDFLEDTFTRQDISWMGRFILLSTFRQVNGAAALFYPGVVEKMMDLLGGPFWAVFMNTSDVSILEKDSPFLKNSLRAARKSTPVGDPLSYKCYVCDESGIHVKE